MNREIIAKILKLKMKRKGVSANELIRELKISKVTVYNILQYGNYRENYGIDNMFRIANYLEK